jgi:hypothetical protein
MTVPPQPGIYLLQSEQIASYRAQKPVTELPQPAKALKVPRGASLERPTEIPGFPLGSSRPGPHVPDYGNTSRVKAMRKGDVGTARPS